MIFSLFFFAIIFDVVLVSKALISLEVMLKSGIWKRENIDFLLSVFTILNMKTLLRDFFYAFPPLLHSHTTKKIVLLKRDY